MSHVLEGASQEDLNLYRAEVERDQAYGNWRDFFLKGAPQKTENKAR